MNSSFFNYILFVAILLVLSLNLSYICTNKSNTFLSRNLNITSRSVNWTKRSLIQPFIPFRSSFVGSTKYGLAACRIQKNLSTILLNIFCYLNTPLKFSRTAELTTQFGNHLSNVICNTTHASHIASDEEYKTKIAIIRDPVERFLSAFVDKCIHEARKKNWRCYGCEGNLLCLLEKQYERFQLITEGKLSNFSYEDRHFAPMSWFCDFDVETIKDFRFLYFGETEEEQNHTLIELMDIFSESGVENRTTSFILKELISNRTKHTTSGSQIRKKISDIVWRNKTVMNWLYLIYQNDYTVLNLKSPF